MIGHEDLIREDDEKLKEQAKKVSSVNSSSTAVDDPEMGRPKHDVSEKEVSNS